MKPLILFFLLVISALSGNTQNTFELLIEGKLDQTTTSLVETNEYYVFSEIYGVISHPGAKTNLYKTDKQGNIISMVGVKPELYEFVLTNLIFEGNGKFTGFGFQKTTEESAAYFTILELDESFSIVTEKQYQTGFYYLDYINVEKSNGDYLIVGSGQYKPLPHYNLFSYLVNSAYDTIRSKVYPEEGLIVAFDIIPVVDQNYFKVFTRGFGLQFSSPGQIILIDNSLNRIKYTEIPEYVFSYMDAKYIDDAHYLLSGKKDIIDENRQTTKLALMRMDTADVMQEIHLFGSEDTITYPGFYSNLDFVDENAIYYAGVKNLAFNYYTPVDSWFFLNKLNSNLEVQWQKFYGGDAYYNLWNVLATQDGGCLMAGTRYDYITQTNLRDLYILKVDANGLIVGTGEELPSISVQDAIVYPNPGNEYFHIQSGPQISGALFELFDLSGNLVLTTTLDERVETISTIRLSTGTYPYRITFDNKMVGSGKWLKK
ncbi:MAG: T9SS type A sorting domain-containing protein [Bacteroidales bacterium]|nr:T9SS type A sorting domain-containing protein [Bacteroidales bacterium]NLO52409.1 T9SS type A sorting domain-containing protein [Bacteroidales bacterium]